MDGERRVKVWEIKTQGLSQMCPFRLSFGQVFVWVGAPELVLGEGAEQLGRYA